MLSKVWTIFDSRLSNIFTLLSPPPDANKFPFLWHTSIQLVKSSKDECKINHKISF